MSKTACWGRTLTRLGLALIYLLTLCACQQVFAPLDERDAPLPQESDNPKMTLVRVATCWAALPLTKDLTAAYLAKNPHLSIDIIPSNSAAARNLVMAGQADLAIIAETASAQDTDTSTEDVALRARPLALDAIAIIVHKDSPLNELSMAELAALYGGYRQDWEELGAGHGRPELLSRERGSAMRDAFEEIVLGGDALSSTAIVMPHDRAILEYVAEHPQAIGYLSRAYVDERVKSLTIDGVMPTPNDLKRSRYPLPYPLVMLSSEDAPVEVTRLVSFAMSSQGRRTIEQRYAASR